MTTGIEVHHRKHLEGGIARAGVTLTPADLRAWQSHMGISGREAARRLGVSPGTYQDWVTGTSRTTKKPIALPPMLGLACAALAAGLGEWRPLR